jgi:hypothetical protein
VLNGSRSSDDLGIVKWEWIRESSSLALGRVIANSDNSSVLMVSCGLLQRTCNKLNFINTWLAEIIGIDPKLSIGYFSQFISFYNMGNGEMF